MSPEMVHVPSPESGGVQPYNKPSLLIVMFCTHSSTTVYMNFTAKHYISVDFKTSNSVTK